MGSITFVEHEVKMMMQLLGNTQLRVSMKGASLERVKRALPLGWVRLSDWPTPMMHPFTAKVRRLLVNPEKMVDDKEIPADTVKVPEQTKPAAPPALSVVFSDPGMKDKTVPVSSRGGSLTKILRAEEKARNYTTAKIQTDGVTIATLYRPLGSMSFQTVAPDPEDR